MHTATDSMHQWHAQQATCQWVVVQDVGLQAGHMTWAPLNNTLLSIHAALGQSKNALPDVTCPRLHAVHGASGDLVRTALLLA